MSTVNNIELKVNLRKNNNEKSDQFGKYYAELERKRTLSLKGLAKHIADHGSIFTRDVIEVCSASSPSVCLSCFHRVCP